jgi:hypothetical protein
MSIRLHFKDGSVVDLGPLGGVVAQPYPGDNNFVEVLNASTPPAMIALASNENLEWAEGY